MTTLLWRSGLEEPEVAEVLALLTAATAADGTAPVGEHVLLHLRRGGDPLAQHLLARDSDADSHPDGTLVGYAHLYLSDPAAGGSSELAVLPDARRHGVGTELVTELLDRVGTRTLRVWAHGEHPGAVRLAEKLGFEQVRTLWQMRRSLLEPLGAGPTAVDRAAELPPGVRLRPFEVGRDEAEFLRVNNVAFDWHPEQGGWGDEQMKLREGEPWFDPAGFLLAVEDTDTGEKLLGFHWTKVHAGDQQHEPIGEVYVLGVDTAARGRRLGAGLTLAGLRYLRGLGLRDVLLYVEGDNHAAIKVYRELGFTRWATDVAYQH